MPNPSDERRRSQISLVTVGDLHKLLKKLAARKSLPLATYLRELIATHPEVAGARRAAGTR